MYTYIKRKLNDGFFHSRMFLGIKLFSIKKSRGYYSNIEGILKGLKEDGYYKVESFYDQNEIDELNKHSYEILDSINEDSFDNGNLEKRAGEIKIKRIERLSRTLNTYSHEYIYVLISIFFRGMPKLPMVIFHLVHDGSFKHNSVPGKSKRRIAQSFHVDSLDRHVLKVIIFLDSVTPETGGETIIVSNSSKKVRYNMNAENLMTYGEGSEKEDDQRENALKELKIITDSNVKHLYGNKGDVIFIDSSHLHKAGLVKKGKRGVLWLYIY